MPWEMRAELRGKLGHVDFLVGKATPHRHLSQSIDAPLVDFPSPFSDDVCMQTRMVPLLPRRGSFGIRTVATGLVFLSLSSCALLFPDRTAPKSQAYNVTPPPAPWHKLAVGDDPNATDAMKADMAYENPETGAIISLNSICRKYNKASLDTLTNNLVRGVGDRKLISRNEVNIDGGTALDTLFAGTVDGVFLHLRTVVLIKNECTYDFIHVSIPKREPENARSFEDFLSSFHTG
jgi:hypothetical protein